MGVLKADSHDNSGNVFSIKAKGGRFTLKAEKPDPLLRIKTGAREPAAAAACEKDETRT
jgi:hypothetical protein